MNLVVDTSAVMAIVLGEPTALRLAERLAACDEAIISAVTLVETCLLYTSDAADDASSV